MEEKGGYPFSGDHFLSGAENYPLHKAMVNHDQQRIKASRKGKVSDKVARDLLKGVGCVGLDQGEWGDGRVCVRLVLLAHGAALDVFLHELCEAWPPEFGGDELAGFEITRVTSGLMVMTVGKDGATEGILQGYIDMTFVGQDMVIILPI